MFLPFLKFIIKFLGKEYFYLRLQDLSFFDHLTPSIYIFYGIKVYKKSILLTTSPPPLVNVVCERPLTSNSKKLTLNAEVYHYYVECQFFLNRTLIFYPFFICLAE